MQSDDDSNFWRPAYEVVAALTWLVCALITFSIGRFQSGGISLFGLISLPMLLMAIYRFRSVISNWNFKSRLWSPMPVFRPIQYVLAKQRVTGKIWMGKGFTWEPIHAARMRAISALGESETQPPPAFLALRRFLGLSGTDLTSDGYHYVHGVGNQEDDILVDKDSFKGHTYIVGTTGAGKTRTFEVLIAQAIARGGPVIVIDPKGDVDLRDRCHAECLRNDKQLDFSYFSLTKPQHSIRIDPLSTYQRRSQIANRIASLLPSSGNATAFRDFAWRAVNVVADGLSEAGYRPDLMNLRRYVEGDTDELVIRATERYFDRIALRDPLIRNWRSEVDALVSKTSSSLTVTLDKASAAKAAAHATYYVTQLKKTHPDKTIEAMISVMMHDRQHYNKLISNLIPLLEQLTSGPLAELLSPNYVDTFDRVHSTNFQDLIQHNSVVYINLDTLADGIVGQAVGSLFLADLTSVAAQRYSLESQANSLPPVSVFVDEASEMINDAFIQNLNKGRGAGFELYIASQTIADFVAKMGDQAMAMQALGNTNTTIALRIVDPETRLFVSNLFGETHFAESSQGRSSSTIDASDVIDFRGMVTKTTQRKDIPLVSEDTLTKLPNLHYLAKLPGGKRIKGRVPIMPIADHERFKPRLAGSRFFQPSSERVDIPLSEAIFRDSSDHIDEVDFSLMHPSVLSPEPTLFSADAEAEEDQSEEDQVDEAQVDEDQVDEDQVDPDASSHQPSHSAAGGL